MSQIFTARLRTTQTLHFMFRVFLFSGIEISLASTETEFCVSHMLGQSRKRLCSVHL